MLDINTANAEEIDAIPMLKGHGYEIVRSRKDRGGFTELRQLVGLPSMTGKTVRIERFIMIGAQPLRRPRNNRFKIGI